MKLEGRTILITGGTSGIGFELAKQLIARPNVVIITGRDHGRLEEAEAALPGIHVIQSDVSNPDDIRALLRRVKADFPACDTLINDAGVMRNLNVNRPGSVTDVTREIDINLNGPIQLVQEFLPLLKSRPDALIVNVSSGLAYIPFPLSPIYSASKAGLHAFTQCLRVQLKGTSVAVVELAPPLVETKLTAGEFDMEMDGQKGMKPAVLVRKAIAGIEAGKLEVRPGLSSMLYLMSRLIPSLPFRQMAKMVPPAS